MKKILFDKRIRLGQLGFTNDPKESKWNSLGILPLDDEAAMKSLGDRDKIIDEAQRIYREEWKVLCMTKHLPKSKYKRVIRSYVMSKFRYGYCRPKMWAQYAKNHAGVCIIFDGNKLHKRIREILKDRFKIFQGSVTYKNYGAVFDKNLDDTYITKYGLTNGIRNFFFENYRDYFLTKYPDWENESEYRWLIHNPENSPEFISIEGTIKSILLGSDFPKVYEPAIKEVCKELKVPAGRILWINGIPNPMFGNIFKPQVLHQMMITTIARGKMRKNCILCLCVVLLTACSTTATPTSTATRVRPSQSPSFTASANFTATTIPSLIGCVNSGITLRMRSGPNTQSEVTNGLASETCFIVYGFNEDKNWAWIDADGKFGWVSVEYSSIEGNIDVLPIVPDNITASRFPTTNAASIITQTPKLPPTKTKTTRPSPTSTPRKTSTPFLIPTKDIILCSNAPAYTNVTCKIPRAYCSYEPTVSGEPTFCNDFPYPSNQFTLLVWGSDWSDLDGYCLIVSGYVDMYAGEPQIVASSRSQVSFCQ